MAKSTLNEVNIEIREEIQKLEDKKTKSGLAVEVVDVFFTPIKSIINTFFNEKMIKKNTERIKKILKLLQNTSTKLVDKKRIVRRASRNGLPVKTIEDFQDIPVEYLDVLANRYLKKNSQYSSLQGAGLGLGSYTLTAVDIPALFMVNMRMILKIGACYGYDPDMREEKEFALHIFYVASTAGKKKEEQIRKIIKLMDSFSKGKFDKKLSILATDEGIKGFIDNCIFKFIKKLITQKVPAVGVALGAHFNYLYTQENARYAQLFYRKRFLRDFG